MSSWRNLGALMIIFLAGLQTIPAEVKEASEVDGAGSWQRFRFITLPMLRPTLLFGAVITSIGYLQFFEEAFVMTRGGPLDSTRSVTFFTYDQFGFGNYGLASAASYLLFLAVVVFTLIQFRLLGDREDKSTTAVQPTLAATTARLYVVLTVGLVLMVLPFVWMVLSSLKTDAEVIATPPTWWPHDITLDNYRTLFTKLDFPRYFLNSVIVAGAVTIGNMVFCSMLGYALAKLEFPGKKVVFGLVLATLMIPGVVTFIPLFILTTNLGLTDTLPGMFLPFLAGPFGVFLMRQFISGLPDELIQAARVDGAGSCGSSARS